MAKGPLGHLKEAGEATREDQVHQKAACPSHPRSEPKGEEVVERGGPLPSQVCKHMPF